MVGLWKRRRKEKDYSMECQMKRWHVGRAAGQDAGAKRGEAEFRNSRSLGTPQGPGAHEESRPHEKRILGK